jgi:uncharacterized protein YacL
MKTRKIIFWIILLIVIDQAIKIVINSFFLEVRVEIIPSLFEFRPVFNDKHSYFNSLLYSNFNINLGLVFHLFLFLLAGIIFVILHRFLRKNISENKKLLDTAFVFATAGLICGLIGNLIWEKGTLDYIYLKPLFIFDLKDLYINCFVILFLVYFLKNRHQINELQKTKNGIDYIKELFKNKEGK